MDQTERLRGIMAALRDPDTGCPWDIEQTFSTIAPYTIEEAHEVADAIEREAWDELRAELGDLLLQVVYHSRMAEEAGLFDYDDVARGIGDKMVARHPHVFGDESRNKTAAQQALDWEASKARERADGGALAGVALGLPALMRAQKLGARAARVGFDWPDMDGVITKVAEEARELAEAPKEAQEEELGDLLFTLTNLARHLGLDAETALRRASAKFERRFGHLEGAAAERGGVAAQDMDALERLWRAAKGEVG
ncbi:MAG: nucleoside triphosphate pyrophosphohydrolase [Paracoccaceae bacterium]